MFWMRAGINLRKVNEISDVNLALDYHGKTASAVLAMFVTDHVQDYPHGKYGRGNISYIAGWWDICRICGCQHHPVCPDRCVAALAHPLCTSPFGDPCTSILVAGVFILLPPSSGDASHFLMPDFKRMKEYLLYNAFLLSASMSPEIKD